MKPTREYETSYIWINLKYMKNHFFVLILLARKQETEWNDYGAW